MRLKTYAQRVLFLVIVGTFFSALHSMQNESKMVSFENEDKYVKRVQAKFQENPGFYAISLTRTALNNTDYPKLNPMEKDVAIHLLRFVLAQPNNLPQLLDSNLEDNIKAEQNYLSKMSQDYEEQYFKISGYVIGSLDQSTSDVLIKYLQLKTGFAYFFNTEEVLKLINLKVKIPEFRHQIAEYIIANEKEILILLQTKKANSFLNQAKSDYLRSTGGGYLFLERVLEFISTEEVSKFFAQKIEDTIGKAKLNYFFNLQAEHREHDYINLRYAEKDKKLQFLERVKNKIVNSDYLIVLNEMFFGKSNDKGNQQYYAPLLYDEFSEISKNIQDLSKIVPSAVFHVNFLHFDDKKMNGLEYKELVQERQNKWPKKLGEPQEDSFFFGPGIPSKSDMTIRSLLSNVKDDMEYSTFKNESLIYSHGRIVGSYQKVSYRDEANQLLRLVSPGGDGALYLFGTGVDQKSEETQLATMVNNTFSTEICFDFNIGVRDRLKSYPPQGKVHIVVSNILPLSLSEGSKDFNHLPDHIPLILHVDPHQQNLFLNSPNRDLFLSRPFSEEVSNNHLQKNKQNDLILQESLFLKPFKLGIGNNVFILKLWDINTAIDQLKKY